MTTRSYFRSISHDASRITSRFPTVAVDGINVFDGTAREAIDACMDLAARGGGRVATANLDFLALARRNLPLKVDLQNSHLVIADGMPVVWLARITGARNVQRLAGVDLVRALFEQEHLPPLRVAIYGSTRDICHSAVPALESLGRGAAVVHIANPPFRPMTDEERAADRTALRDSSPDVVLVALGCPVQERLIAEWFSEIPSAVWIGIGGTLDFYAGVRRRAPRAAQRFGFEWTVRMAQEPRRLGRRYLFRDLPTLAALLPRCAASRVMRSQRLDITQP